MRRLRSRSAGAIDAGLTEKEFARVEEEFGFEFANDHRAFLAAGLPVNTRPQPRQPGVIDTNSEPWPDWRNGDLDKLRERLDWPTQGILFDVEHNSFWHDRWGPRPNTSSSAMAVARDMLAVVPRMVPVYGHRYLPAGRGTFGHPVLSMWQSDIIYYGLDLVDYVDREFGRGHLGHVSDSWNPRATVDFWRDLV